MRKDSTEDLGNMAVETVAGKVVGMIAVLDI